MTNFHLPKSTLMILTCAFGGYDLIIEAYRKAIRDQYKFSTYGDAMLILNTCLCFCRNNYRKLLPAQDVIRCYVKQRGLSGLYFGLSRQNFWWLGSFSVCCLYLDDCRRAAALRPSPPFPISAFYGFSQRPMLKERRMIEG